jgi:uncharacterized OB-fold protein
MSDWLVSDSLAPTTAGPLAALYAAAATGELALPHCQACGLALELDQTRCDRCGTSEIGWHRVERIGVVHSVTTVHRREPDLIVADGPYHVVDVETASGHRIVMTTDRPAAVPPRIGDRGTIVFRHVGGVAVPALATTDPSNAEGAS